ncbi:YbdK family carboxylate-amine ligase [Glutamicibacter mishrai]|uniref:carboxylate-amine ligase n=1 Tax=Glutamicibacter mishrai TaxID=1775880 RepID=UPI0020CE08F9|nr:YbdK family carboxylate-amine ligase [Glutamicibacter mishrai]UTT39411.1 YbdK family carboxylate-amine ligase [Glutamicibacter mishrai]
MSSFGIEEEFFLFDGETGLPADSAGEQFRQALDSQRDGEVQNEFLACQMEHASAICQDREQALEELAAFRRDLAAQADSQQLLVAGVGTAPIAAPRPPELADNERYRQIGKFLSGIASEHYICGLHVHVSVPDPQSGVMALNFLRGWLPFLCALGANSPYWKGADSSFSSWRTIHSRQWSVQGIPPYFKDYEDYAARLQRINDAPAVPDSGHIGWAARLSDKYPTIEIRVADSQLRAHDSVLLAVLMRGLVDTALSGKHVPADYLPEILDLSLWQGAKHGIGGAQVDTETGRSATVEDVAGKMLRLIEDALRAHGDYEFAVISLRNLLESGNGAVRQRVAFDQGGLLHLLANAHAEMQM